MELAILVATLRPVVITESLSASARVDREAGVIRNVKLIGFESKNGRLYPPAVLKSAVHLYEGSKVNIDHPEGNDPARARKYGERFGIIRNVHFVEGAGNFGDFHFNPKHSMAEQVIWDAENNPESLGFSHNALLKLGDMQNGKQLIEQIVAIRSMDLVADPATTTSLFESQDHRPMDDPHMAPGDTDPKSRKWLAPNLISRLSSNLLVPSVEKMDGTIRWQSVEKMDGTIRWHHPLSAPSVVQVDQHATSNSQCESFRDIIIAKGDIGLTAKRIHQDLVADHGVEGKYWSVNRFVKSLGVKRELPFRRMEVAPGEE